MELFLIFSFFNLYNIFKMPHIRVVNDVAKKIEISIKYVSDISSCNVVLYKGVTVVE